MKNLDMVKHTGSKMEIDMEVIYNYNSDIMDTNYNTPSVPNYNIIDF